MENKIKCCKECPWDIRNKNNDSIVEHSKKWKKKHNCHMLIKDMEFKLWDDFPKFQCIGNKIAKLRIDPVASRFGSFISLNSSTDEFK